jgi:hypothetical protein
VTKEVGMKNVVSLAVGTTLLFVGCGGGESAGNAPSPSPPSPSPEPAGVTVELAISYEWAYGVPKWQKEATGPDCYDSNFEQDVQVLDNADAILTVGEFPEAGVWEWTGEDTGTCTWSASLGEVGESPVYTVETVAGSETMNADELADGVVAIAGESGSLWVSICPSKDVNCKKYE